MSSGLHSHDRFWKDGTGQAYSRPSDFPTEGATIDISAVDADFTASPLRWIFVTTAGLLQVELVGDPVATPHLFPVAANSVFKGIVRKVVKAGTTAGGLVGAR